MEVSARNSSSITSEKMPRKVFSSLRIVQNFSSSRRGGCEDSPTSPLSPRTPSSSSDGAESPRRRARHGVRRLALGAAAKLRAVPRDIPQGCMAVYVGRERKRFVISTHYLNHHLFKALLKRTEEEFGFEYGGGLLIACEAVLFEHLLWLIGTNDPKARTTELEDLLEFRRSPV